MRSASAKFGSEPANFDKLWVAFGRGAEFGQFRPGVAQIWPDVVCLGMRLAHLGQHLDEFGGPSRPSLGRHRPSSASTPPNLGRFRPTLARGQPNWGLPMVASERLWCRTTAVPAECQRWLRQQSRSSTEPGRTSVVPVLNRVPHPVVVPASCQWEPVQYRCISGGNSERPSLKEGAAPGRPPRLMFFGCPTESIHNSLPQRVSKARTCRICGYGRLAGWA